MLFLHSFFVCLSICLVVDSSVVFPRDCSCISCVGAFKSQIHIQQVFHSFWPGHHSVNTNSKFSFFFLSLYLLPLFVLVYRRRSRLLVAGCLIKRTTEWKEPVVQERKENSVNFIIRVTGHVNLEPPTICQYSAFK